MTASMRLPLHAIRPAAACRLLRRFATDTSPLIPPPIPLRDDTPPPCHLPSALPAIESPPLSTPPPVFAMMFRPCFHAAAERYATLMPRRCRHSAADALPPLTLSSFTPPPPRFPASQDFAAMRLRHDTASAAALRHWPMPLSRAYALFSLTPPY